MREWLPSGWSPDRVLVVDRHRALGDLLFVAAVLARMRAVWPRAEIVLAQAESDAARALHLERFVDAIHPLGEWQPVQPFDLSWLVYVEDPARDPWMRMAEAHSTRIALHVVSPDERDVLEERGDCLVRITYSGTRSHRRDRLMSSVFGDANDHPASPSIDPLHAAQAAQLRQQILARENARGLAFFVPTVGDWLPQRRVPNEILDEAARAAREQGLAVVRDGDAELPSMDVSMLLALIAQSDLVVSGDTGPAHAAVALGVPNITIFGPTSKRMRGHREQDRGADVDALACPFGASGDADPAVCARHCTPGAARCFAPAAGARLAVEHVCR